MDKAVLTLLVGLMLSLGGGASALTFKSDGSVVQNDGTVVSAGGGEQQNRVFKSTKFISEPEVLNNQQLCELAVEPFGNTVNWTSRPSLQNVVFEAKQRNLNCGTPPNGIVVSNSHTGSFSLATRSGDSEVTFLPNQRAIFLGGQLRKLHNSELHTPAIQVAFSLSDEQSCSGIDARKSSWMFYSEYNLRGRDGILLHVEGPLSLKKFGNGRYLNIHMNAATWWQSHCLSIIDTELLLEKNNLAKFQAHHWFSNNPRSTGDLTRIPKTRMPKMLDINEEVLLTFACNGNAWEQDPKYFPHVSEAKHRGLQCLEFKKRAEKDASSGAEADLLAAQKRAHELEKRLASLEAEKELKKLEITTDESKPSIRLSAAFTIGPKGVIKGVATDDSAIADVHIDGRPVPIDGNGSFESSIYVPDGGISITIEAFDVAGLSSSISVRLDRATTQSTTVLDFDRLNPIARETINNPNALALIIGLEQYEKTDAKAAYADADAKVFTDYASLKLGIPQNRIKTLVNDNAEITDVLLSVKNWLSRAVKQQQSDVYIFFAGHGLASDDGEKMYLLPYDGAPELLDKTSILRDELFTDIAAANPRSVTVFLDTCYSGTTRGPDMLIASRPITIRAKEQAVPEGFTVMTAAAGNQTAKPLEEAKHGLFSYFLMKGMEGDADANRDNQITAGELHAYVQQNVIQQSSGSQTPELQGDADRVLVRFQ